MAKTTKSKKNVTAQKQSQKDTPKDESNRTVWQNTLAYIRKNPVKILFISFAVLLICILGYGYAHTRSELEKANNPEAAGRSEAEKITNSVRKYVALPQETPTLATVKDVTKLSNQAFFIDAQNGDKVLIFQKSGKALIYRPATKQIIEFSAVSTTGESGQ